MTIEHKNITEADLHEPKGVSSANTGQVYVADGLGSGDWEDQVVIPTYSLAVLSELFVYSEDSQEPQVADTPLQITFGAGDTGTDVEVDSLGNISVLTDGFYNLEFTGRLSRTSNAGESTLMVRYLANGVPQGTALAETLDDGKFSIPLTIGRILELPAGLVLTLEIQTDSGGILNGGLEPFEPVDTSWSPIPSASLKISRLGVV